MKGFDIYQRIDELMATPEFKGRIEFSYVGNVPKGFSFKNARLVTPLDGVALAEELKRHHVYVTGSINEPGGNHQNEAGACGLPLMYRRSGCLPEYCEGFGISFDEHDFDAVLSWLTAFLKDLGIQGKLADIGIPADRAASLKAARSAKTVEGWSWAGTPGETLDATPSTGSSRYRIIAEHGVVSSECAQAMAAGVPIVVVPFKINDKLSYFLELDLPVTVSFLTAKASVPGSRDRVLGELTMLLQTGFAF